MTEKEIKRELWEWGNALYYCGRKQDEIQRLESLINDMRLVGAPELTGMPKGTKISNATQSAAVRIIDTYMNAIQKLTDEIDGLVKHKLRMDVVISMLSVEQKKLLELRYMKGYGWDYIPLQMHFSRRHCFRIHDEAIKNMALDGTKVDLYCKDDEVS